MRALIIIDVQNDFLTDGLLVVPEGEQIIPVLNNINHHFDVVVATKDWHPATHKSFARNHEDREVGEIVEVNEVPQILWPPHCVKESHGAEFPSDLNTEVIEKVFWKGTNEDIDDYSGFYDNEKLNDTGLHDFLQSKGVTEVYVAGIALDFCVKFTALDAKSLGYKTFMIEDASRGINYRPNDVQNAITDMKVSGIRVIKSYELEKVFSGDY
ncbi:bifunctional nicotinamidase/pyrazinamidase [Flammeovirga yaeyamensis]|uniref:Nicotinamidase n=1 Tax=Flammeovirga yaeyamensis TaxID=367791 RepID=A0AAX1N0R9_9BACT|nr:MULTISPECIES: bifunctional nicotinamidase/pyrazinamidase [Flammeovirga]ANQ47535.1 bifunctional nicotinamidase/pyrazinamidase [Flammeovirga sp. MY04]MBB3698574.1 nicotinamidase/pyrazinamidase [Flammeovirga yaeyamensis]NMF34077.1 bifunctional nicotinamidase/pyrazinamidase [Flammeovirga yaeyamensis]QWG01065.1 bifunctional nicotinamidase/pyrazinamidase [Flammeovirga yaeyamensis]